MRRWRRKKRPNCFMLPGMNSFPYHFLGPFFLSVLEWKHTAYFDSSFFFSLTIYKYKNYALLMGRRVVLAGKLESA